MKDRLARKQMDSVKRLCNSIGHGVVMSWASALCRRELQKQGQDTSKSIVPRLAELGPEEARYDKLVEKFEKHRDVVKFGCCIIAGKGGGYQIDYSDDTSDSFTADEIVAILNDKRNKWS